MSVQFDLPKIQSETAEGQIAELRSYLWQFVEKLNYVFNYIDTGAASSSGTELQTSSGGFSGVGETDLTPTGRSGDSVANVSDSGGWLVRRWSSGFKDVYTFIDVKNEDVSVGKTFTVTLPSGIEVGKIVGVSASFNGNDYFEVLTRFRYKTCYVRLRPFQQGAIATGRIYLHIALKA